MNFFDPQIPVAAFSLSGLASGHFIPSFKLLQLFPYDLVKYPGTVTPVNPLRS